jgi:tetraacyldisaccharide 4'-kinase
MAFRTAMAEEMVVEAENEGTINGAGLPAWKRALFFVPGKLYEMGVRLRIALYETEYLKPKELTKPVISVGNLTLGGTGKTPLVEFIARYLTEEGHEVAILTRGYKRADASRPRVVVSDGAGVKATLAEAGDEPLMLARRLPGVKVVVGPNRHENGLALEESRDCDVFLLDDGFQHIQLKRDLNILVLDATDPFGNGEMAPFGPLREPLYALRRADAIVVTRADRSFDQDELQSVLDACEVSAPVLFSYHEMTGLRDLATGKPQAQRSLFNQKTGVFSALGKPVIFEDDVANAGANVVYTKRFGDHHRYTQADADQLVAEARAAGAERLVTTEKDAVKLETLDFQGFPVSVVEIKVQFEDEVGLKSLLLRTIVRKQGKYYKKPKDEG